MVLSATLTLVDRFVTMRCFKWESVAIMQVAFSAVHYARDYFYCNYAGDCFCCSYVGGSFK